MRKLLLAILILLTLSAKSQVRLEVEFVEMDTLEFVALNFNDQRFQIHTERTTVYLETSAEVDEFLNAVDSVRSGSDDVIKKYWGVGMVGRALIIYDEHMGYTTVPNRKIDQIISEIREKQKQF